MKYFSPRRIFSASLLISFAALVAIELSAAAQVAKTPETHVSHARKSYAKLPLSFELNQGQTDPRVRFLSRGYGYSLFLTDSSAVLALGQSRPCNTGTASAAARADVCSELSGQSSADVVKMTLAGASRRAADTRIFGDDQLPGKVNHFIGNDPHRWRTDLPTYAKVRYTGVYPGVDLIYYGNQRQLEYDFVVAPGADPNMIRLKFDGEEQLSIAPGGDLVLKGAQGSATVKNPLIYQVREGQRQPISGNLRLIANSTIGFSVGRYDHKETPHH